MTRSAHSRSFVRDPPRFVEWDSRFEKATATARCMTFAAASASRMRPASVCDVTNTPSAHSLRFLKSSRHEDMSVSESRSSGKGEGGGGLGAESSDGLE